jgi:hypothetical protein
VYCHYLTLCLLRRYSAVATIKELFLAALQICTSRSAVMLIKSGRIMWVRHSHRMLLTERYFGYCSYLNFRLGGMFQV